MAMGDTFHYAINKGMDAQAGLCLCCSQTTKGFLTSRPLCKPLRVYQILKDSNISLQDAMSCDKSKLYTFNILWTIKLVPEKMKTQTQCNRTLRQNQFSEKEI